MVEEDKGLSRTADGEEHVLGTLIPAYEHTIRHVWSSRTLQQFLLLAISILIYCPLAWSYGLHIDTGGDEPVYLTMMHSIVVDHDVNLANNFAQQDYTRFYASGQLDGKVSTDSRPGYGYTLFRIGLPILAVPAYALGLALGDPHPFVAVFMALLMALAALNIYLIALRVSGSVIVGWLVWVALCLSLPLASHAVAIYPDVVMVLFVSYLFRKFVVEWQSWRRYDALLCGVLLGYFPWLHFKFMALFICFVVVGLAQIVRHRSWQLEGPRIAGLAVPILLLFLGHSLTNYAMYGSYAFDAGYHVIDRYRTPGQASAGSGDAIRAALSAFSYSTWGMFIDGKEGLFVIAPVYLLGLASALYRGGIKRDFGTLSGLVIMVPFYLGVMSVMRWWKGGGGSFPDRFILPVLPICAYFLALYVARALKPGARLERIALVGSLLWGILNVLTFVADPVSLLRYTPSLYDLQFVFPNYFLMTTPGVPETVLQNQWQLVLVWGSICLSVLAFLLLHWLRHDDPLQHTRLARLATPVLGLVLLSLASLAIVLPSSRASFLAMTAQSAFEAEASVAEAGVPVDDAAASAGRSVRSTGVGYMLVSQPFQVPSGMYRVTYWIRCAGQTNPNQPLARFYVTTDLGRQIIAEDTFPNEHYYQCTGYAPYTIDFQSHAEGGVELTAFSLGATPFWIDKVSVTRTEDIDGLAAGWFSSTLHRAGLQQPPDPATAQPEWSRTFTATDLPSATGELHDGIRQVRVSANQPDWMIYGPGLSFHSGTYRATYRLRLDARPTDRSTPVATLNIGANLGEQTIANQVLHANAFHASGEWQAFDLPFQLPQGADNLEFRVYWNGQANISFAQVTVTKLLDR